MRSLYLLAVPVLLTAQEVRPPERGEERREPNRIERPEPVRVHPQPPEERRSASPRPDPQPQGLNRPYDPYWTRRPFRIEPCMTVAPFPRRQQTLRPNRLEMAPIRPPLTDKQKRQLQELQEEYRQKRHRILNNP